MAFFLPLTTIIEAFTYTSKPYFCEFPVINDELFENFTRAVRVQYIQKIPHEVGINRLHESMKSMEHHIIHLRFTNEADIRLFMTNLRTGFVGIINTGFYPWIEIDSADLEQGDGLWLGTLTISCKRVGKLRDV